MSESAPTPPTIEHVHKWKYLFGQGAIHRCIVCRVIGHRIWDGTGAIEPMTCDYEGCYQPALMHGEHGLSCKDHADIELVGHGKRKSRVK